MTGPTTLRHAFDSYPDDWDRRDACMTCGRERDDRIHKRFDVLDTFPFRVRYPYKGTFHLLQWYSHNEGNHVIMSRRVKPMLQIWDRVLYDHGAEPKLHMLATIVAPSETMCRMYAERAFRNEAFQFKSVFSGYLSSYEDAFKKLPPQVAKCDNPINEAGEPMPAGEDDYTWRSRHDYCVNCCYGYVIKGRTREELHPLLRERVLSDAIQGERRRASIAPRPTKGKILWAVTEQPGHHSSGTSIVQVPNWEKLKEDTHFPTEVQFFFHGVKLAIPKHIRKSIRDQKKRWALRERKDKADSKKRDKQYQEDCRDLVHSVLEGL